MCSICNDQYQESVVENPWWAVRYQTCKKCGQSQIPRIDILAEANAIEHDPNVQALYGEGLEDSGDEQIMDEEAGEEGMYTYAEGEGADTGKPQEYFGSGIDGLLEREEASKLLVLMCHARTCTGCIKAQNMQRSARALSSSCCIFGIATVWTSTVVNVVFPGACPASACFSTLHIAMTPRRVRYAIRGRYPAPSLSCVISTSS